MYHRKNIKKALENTFQLMFTGEDQKRNKSNVHFSELERRKMEMEMLSRKLIVGKIVAQVMIQMISLLKKILIKNRNQKQMQKENDHWIDCRK